MVFLKRNRKVKTLKKTCSLCGQKTDVYTRAHKTSPFVDNQTYETLCFTCYFVPKTLEQKYNPQGFVIEEKELPYSADNLSTPQELYRDGASDTLKQAKISVEAVRTACIKLKKPPKNPILRPKASWNIC